MASTDLEVSDDAPILELKPAQEKALLKLQSLGALPRADGDKYHSDPKIRALQLVYEDRMGGGGRGQGRKKIPRASEGVAAHVRTKVKAINNAIDDGLDSDDIKVRMDAVRTALKIENEEATLQLREDQFDKDTDDQSKDELIALLFQELGNPQVQAALEGAIDAEAEEITDAEVIGAPALESDSRGIDRGRPQSGSRVKSSASPKKIRDRRTNSGGNESATISRSSKPRKSS